MMDLFAGPEISFLKQRHRLLAQPRKALLTIQDISALQEVVRPLQLDERMIALAAAISIDFDYFSQHSHGPGSVPYPKDYLMLCVVSSCSTKASVALGQHIAGHLGATACEVLSCELHDRL